MNVVQVQDSCCRTSNRETSDICTDYQNTNSRVLIQKQHQFHLHWEIRLYVCVVSVKPSWSVINTNVK